MENIDVQEKSKAGRGFGTAGFVISLIALVLWFFVSAAIIISASLGGSIGLAVFWVIFSIIGLLLSSVGYWRANKGGGKRGLAIAGLIIGLIASVLSIITVFTAKEAQAGFEKFGGGYLITKQFIGEGTEQMNDSIASEIKESFNKSVDSLSKVQEE